MKHSKLRIAWSALCGRMATVFRVKTPLASRSHQLRRPFSDWKTEIAIAWRVQESVRESDLEGIWNYHLPHVAGGEEEILRVENTLGYQLDPKYRAYLRFADGWPDFFQSIDIFGTDELSGGKLMKRAGGMLNEYVDQLREECKLTPDDVLPIAVAKHDLDLFVIVSPSKPLAGTVLWLAGSHFEQFPDFNEFFLSMVDYNRLQIQRFKTKMSSPKET